MANISRREYMEPSNSSIVRDEYVLVFDGNEAMCIDR